MRALILVALTVVGPLGAAELRAGVAKANLDPPYGIPMAGYGTDRFATGTLDPLEARVLALSDGSRTIALVTLDLCYTFDAPVLEQIRAAMRGQVDEVIFHASHTHSGPTYSAAPRSRPARGSTRSRPPYQAALAHGHPRRIGNAWGQTYIGFNRRYLAPMAPSTCYGATKCACPAPFPSIPPSASSASTARQHAARHPGQLRLPSRGLRTRQPRLIRPITPAKCAATSNRRWGDGSMAFFLQGAPGDINPYYDKTPLIEDAERHEADRAAKLGAEAVRIARTHP